MHIAMLGENYSYGLMPAYAGKDSYVRSPSYLGADTAPAATAQQYDWWQEVKDMADRGLGVLSQVLDKKIAEANAKGSLAEAQAAQALKDTALATGRNPFTGKAFTQALPWVAVGGVALVAVILIASKRRR